MAMSPRSARNSKASWPVPAALRGASTRRSTGLAGAGAGLAGLQPTLACGARQGRCRGRVAVRPGGACWRVSRALNWSGRCRTGTRTFVVGVVVRNHCKSCRL